MSDTLREEAKRIARAFHEAYEDIAPRVGYRTREESAKPWHEVPKANRELMVLTVMRLLEHGDIGNRP